MVDEWRRRTKGAVADQPVIIGKRHIGLIRAASQGQGAVIAERGHISQNPAPDPDGRVRV